MQAASALEPPSPLVNPGGAGWRSEIAAEAGSNRDPDEVQPSFSPSQSERPAKKLRTILIVEDNRADVFLIRESLEAAHIDADLHVVPDGEKAIRFFQHAELDAAAPCPDVVLLDINIPKRQGRDVLKRLRQSSRCANALVLVVTSSDSAHDREEMTELGAKGYFRKPSDYRDFLKLGDLVKALLAEAPGGEAS